MEDTMTSARDAAIRPSPMAPQLNSTPTNYLTGPAVAEVYAFYGGWGFK